MTERGIPVYRLASAVPAHWIPLLPVRLDGDSAEVRLARAAVLDLDGGRRRAQPGPPCCSAIRTSRC